jgi:hypothetical protein
VRVETRLFSLLCALMFAFAIVYGLYTWGDSGRVEVAGTTALVLSGGLCLIIASYFAFVARRIDLRPEDRTDADIAEGAGELGFFSPGSYWPFGLALSALIAGLGLVYWQVWLLAAGLLAVLGATGGLLFEYYSGARRAAE